MNILIIIRWTMEREINVVLHRKKVLLINKMVLYTETQEHKTHVNFQKDTYTKYEPSMQCIYLSNQYNKFSSIDDLISYQ